ncbi:unnamed protein product [Rotaria sp. Silwood1]|nr:unnamed protein product [Rotaria sp. Silwood1]CAF1626181.1 unnamed protein product [Rotaria sp. Silwood1]
MTGAAYCGLSPQSPQQRLNILVKETGSRFVLVHSMTQNLFSDDVTELNIDEIINSRNIAHNVDVDQLSRVAVIPENIAYVIFTSGSTGIPKAGQLRHRNLIECEVLTAKLVRLLRSYVEENCLIWNLYGPSEITMGCTYHKVDETSEKSNICIGRSFPNYQCRIVNEMLQPVIVNQEGELLVGGVGIFAGYLGRDDLTAKTLIEIDDELFYRTGDLVRLDSNGFVHYVGRKDHQVKLRGQRIELGEIEQCLLQSSPQVTACVVTKYDDEHLVAYVQSSDIDEELLQTYCHSHLPQYMVPSKFIILQQVPLNANGKMDRQRLPIPDFSSSKSSTGFDANDCAIIGMAGVFPGCNNIDEFWSMLKEGRSGIVTLSDDELRSYVPEELLKNPRYVRRTGRLTCGIDLFDHAFFGTSPREASLTDPQHRLLLEVVYRACEDAAVNLQSPDETIGCFIAASDSSYYLFNLQHLHDSSDKQPTVERQMRLNNMMGTMATKLAYYLDLTGAAINVQTACSSGLVALQVAIDHLRLGRCTVAIVGTSCIHLPTSGYLYEPGSIYSPIGQCAPFDASANGIVLGDSVSAVVLKLASRAVVHRHNIRALIKSCAVNNNGSVRGAASFAAPNAIAQAECIRGALTEANVNATDIVYVEGHGTGTAVGDPIEVEGLTLAFDTFQRQYCVLGSVKSNVGHTDIAAGLVARAPKIPFISTVTGNWLDEDYVPDIEYWCRHMRQTVLWHQAVKTLDQQNSSSPTERSNKTLYIECSLNNILTNVTKASVKAESSLVLPSASTDTTNVELSIKQALSTCWCHGLEDIDFQSVYNSFSGSSSVYNNASFISMPGQVFNRQRHWIDAPSLHQLKENITKQPSMSTVDADEIKQHETIQPMMNSSSLITQLIEIFVSVTGDVLTNKHSDFFASGGDSHTAIILISRINHLFNVKLTNKDLTEMPVLEQLAARIEQIKHKKILQTAPEVKMAQLSSLLHLSYQDDQIIVMKKGTCSSQAPIFVIAPTGGTCFIYRDLCKYLNTSITVLALKYPDISPSLSSEHCEDSVANLASYYIEVMRSIQPEATSYILLGTSFGGMIGYEMSQQLSTLSSTSVHISRLFMIDTPTKESLRIHLDDTTSNNNKNVRAIVLWAMFGTKYNFSLAQAEHECMKDEEELKRFCIDKKILSSNAVDLDTEFRELCQYMHIFGRNMRAIDDYTVEPLKSRLTEVNYIQVKSPLPHDPVEPYRTWSQAVPRNQFKLFHVDGDHLSVNFEPYVQQLASLINRELLSSSIS